LIGWARLIYAPRTLRRLACSGILVLGVWACSSTNDGETADDVNAGDAAPDVAVTVDAPSNVSMDQGAPPADRSMSTTMDTGTAADAKTPPGDAPKIVDAGQVDASMDCVKYCSCMATWCPDKIFATGCLVECSRQTNWDLACRTNMCTLVKPQPNNDHCTHAFGIGQCTDN
jgi:hypothetical protein